MSYGSVRCAGGVGTQCIVSNSDVAAAAAIVEEGLQPDGDIVAAGRIGRERAVVPPLAAGCDLEGEVCGRRVRSRPPAEEEAGPPQSAWGAGRRREQHRAACQA